MRFRAVWEGEKLMWSRSIEILLKPETARFSSEMLLRRTIVVDLKTEEAERGDSARLINSLGYSYVRVLPSRFVQERDGRLMRCGGRWKFVLVRRGVELRRGGVIVLIYQLYKVRLSPSSSPFPDSPFT